VWKKSGIGPIQLSPQASRRALRGDGQIAQVRVQADNI
jgi:hypothetical protein